MKKRYAQQTNNLTKAVIFELRDIAAVHEQKFFKVYKLTVTNIEPRCQGVIDVGERWCSTLMRQKEHAGYAAGDVHARRLSSTMFSLKMHMEGGRVSRQESWHIGKTAMAAVDSGKSHELSLTRRRLFRAYDVHELARAAGNQQTTLAFQSLYFFTPQTEPISKIQNMNYPRVFILREQIASALFDNTCMHRI
ncbi:unnamed protein product [Trichogramma brassicae]|uniref:Uncharacterized protein n=1 Tax=Trichogramma brassicae TaxID=86971 RepID=A0A6H5IE23_9HYME|nr:unnamed protein product [Trichogramma brassicae]